MKMALWRITQLVSSLNATADSRTFASVRDIESRFNLALEFLKHHTLVRLTARLVTPSRFIDGSSLEAATLSQPASLACMQDDRSASFAVVEAGRCNTAGQPPLANAVGAWHMLVAG